MRHRLFFALSLLLFFSTPTIAHFDYGHLSVTLANLFQMPFEQYYRWNDDQEKAFVQSQLDVIKVVERTDRFIQVGFEKPAFALASWEEAIILKLRPDVLKQQHAQVLSSLASPTSPFRKVWKSVSIMDDLAIIKLNNFSGVIVIDFKEAGYSFGRGRSLNTQEWTFGDSHFGEKDDRLLVEVNAYLQDLFFKRSH